MCKWICFSISNFAITEEVAFALVAWTIGGFICTFSLSISLWITLWTCKFRNQFTISSKYLGMAIPIFVPSLLRFSEMTSELIRFNHLVCHSSSTALGTRTGYWKPTCRGKDETPHEQHFRIEVELQPCAGPSLSTTSFDFFEPWEDNDLLKRVAICEPQNLVTCEQQEVCGRSFGCQVQSLSIPKKLVKSWQKKGMTCELK